MSYMLDKDKLKDAVIYQLKLCNTDILYARAAIKDRIASGNFDYWEDYWANKFCESVIKKYHMDLS